MSSTRGLSYKEGFGVESRSGRNRSRLPRVLDLGDAGRSRDARGSRRSLAGPGRLLQRPTRARAERLGVRDSGDTTRGSRGRGGAPSPPPPAPPPRPPPPP